MRILLLLTLLATNFIFAQVGSTIVQQGNAISKDTVHFAIINYDKDVTYIIDFGDNNNRFIEKNSFDSTKPIKHVYSKEGSYVLNLSKFNNDATRSVLNVINVSVEKPRTKLKITKIIFKDYNPVKSDGRAWDNLMGGTYPDVFVAFLNYEGDKNTHKNSSIKYDVKTKTEVEWIFDDVYFEGEHLKDGFQIHLNDYDSVSSNDFMSGVRFKDLLNHGAFKKKEGVIEYTDLEKHNCVYSIEYVWE